MSSKYKIKNKTVKTSQVRLSCLEENGEISETHGLGGNSLLGGRNSLLISSELTDNAAMVDGVPDFKP